MATAGAYSRTAAHPAANWAALPPAPPTADERASAVAARVAEDLRATRMARLAPARMKRATLRRISFDAWYRAMRAHANARDELSGARGRAAADLATSDDVALHPQVRAAARLLVSLGRGSQVYRGFNDAMTGGVAISYWSDPEDRTRVTTASDRHVLQSLGDRAARRALRDLAIGLDVLEATR